MRRVRILLRFQLSNFPLSKGNNARQLLELGNFDLKLMKLNHSIHLLSSSNSRPSGNDGSKKVSGGGSKSVVESDSKKGAKTVAGDFSGIEGAKTVATTDEHVAR